MKLDLSFEIRTLYDKDVIMGVSADKAYGWNITLEILAGTTKYFKAVKAYVMTLELKESEMLNLDLSDLNDLYKEIDENQNFNNYIKGPILLAIEEAKKKPAPEKSAEEKSKKNK